MDNAGMLLRTFHRIFVPVSIALVVAMGAGVTRLAAAVPPVVVFPRVLAMPLPPTGGELPLNVPLDGALTMPWVVGGEPGVARRINDAVWREMLDGASAPTGPGDTFTPPPDQLPQGTVSLGYQAELMPKVNPRLLTLDFSGEACGAYCEEFTLTRVFDLRDGRLISLGDLLTATGFAVVGRRVDSQRRSAYRKQVRQLQASRRSASGDQKDSVIDDAGRLALNEACLRRVDAEPSTPESLLGHSFKFNSLQGLELLVGRCSNHASRALDDVGEITVTIKAPDLKASLTPYGQALLLQQRKAPLHGNNAGHAKPGQ
jgi:hypothetical protein